MKTVIYIIAMLLTANNVWAQSNTGIGTLTPTNKLHVVSAADPVRIEGLQANGNITGTLVTDATGVIKVKNPSAVRVTGNVTFVTDNVFVFTDATAAPAKTFDNLNEFSGHTFTAAQAGVYHVTFTTRFNQRSSANDGGDGFHSALRINAGSGPTPPIYLDDIADKVTLPEAGGATLSNSLTMPAVIKLTAGQLIQFKVLVFGSTGNATADYVICISRID